MSRGWWLTRRGLPSADSYAAVAWLGCMRTLAWVVPSLTRPS
jgi:hypothetical protein